MEKNIIKRIKIKGKKRKDKTIVRLDDNRKQKEICH